MTAITVFKNELFEYAIQSLCDGEMEDTCILKEAVYLVSNTFHLLPIPFKLDMILDKIVDVEDPTKNLINAFVEILESRINTDITTTTIEWMKEILDTAKGNLPSSFSSEFFELVLDWFINAGVPETLEWFLYDSNEKISKAASEIWKEYFNEELDQIYDLPSRDADNSETMHF